jgi:DNA-binding CsgD family transcriptional regulator
VDRQLWQPWQDLQEMPIVSFRALMTPPIVLPHASPRQQELLWFSQRQQHLQQALWATAHTLPISLSHIVAQATESANGFARIHTAIMRLASAPGLQRLRERVSQVEADLRRLPQPDTPPEQFEAAARRLVWTIPLRRNLAKPRARRALWALARSDPQGRSPITLLTDRLLPEGLMVAARDAWTPQCIRLRDMYTNKQQWKKGPTGRKVTVVPAMLPIEEFAGWLRQRCYAEAAASVLNAIGDHYSGDPVDLTERDQTERDQTEDRPQAAQDPIDAAVAAQYGRHPSRFPTPENLLAAKRLSVTLAAALSPRQAAALHLRQAGSSYEEIARLLHVCESTARQHVLRARRKVRKLAM